jgi:hypothetical protein
VGTVSPEDIEQRFEAYRPRVMPHVFESWYLRAGILYYA